ncbi:hypothetical protein FXV77_09470 [Sphingobacterium phlebotomi]|uniref:Uncharacterized protein n=1 Tax=Sphingobacterium phlebotomi TaxID=2605433 RepID=A0A5D4H844_9SPHI|nr:hypothetical protein [Sphingobacterium phlebotomi]TYR36139.1 hypothetical protein FXV77_09470 [Sphingobacterium phlebotomi]
MQEFIQRIIRSWKGTELNLKEERYVNPLEAYTEKKEEMIRSAATFLPKNYPIDESLLVEAMNEPMFASVASAHEYLLSRAKKMKSIRRPLPIKEKYSYFLWQTFCKGKKELIEVFSKDERLIEIKEEKMELSAAKADILILSSGGSHFGVNHLLSKIDLTDKYTIICSIFSESEIREHVLYRVDKTINPYKIKRELANFDFIEEIIKEASKA